MNLYQLSFLCLLLSLWQCQPKTTPTTTSTEVSKTATNDAYDWETEAQRSYPLGEKVQIALRNISSETLTVLNPMELAIQKEVVEGKWQSLRWLYCPCGASCPPPPEQMAIPVGERQKYTWKPQEEWCEDQAQGRPITKKQDVEAGHYRILVQYRKASQPQKILTYEVSFMMR